MGAHAKKSPSSAHRWSGCAGSAALAAAIIAAEGDQSSKFAAEGTAAHKVAAACLEENRCASEFLHEVIVVDGIYRITVDEAMVEHVNNYAAYVRERAVGGHLLVERRVRYGPDVGLHDPKDGFGTSDAIIFLGRRLIVADLKYGMGVRVDAEENEQALLYAVGALYEFGMMGDFDEVEVVIHQPRLNHVSSYVIPVAELRDFADRMAKAVARADEAEAAIDFDPLGDISVEWAKKYLSPSEKRCRFCKVKGPRCPAMTASVMEIIGGKAPVASVDDFKSLVPYDVDAKVGDNYLSAAMAKVGLVEDWCKAVRAEVERRLLAGKKVEGFKLVEGRKGPRAWGSIDEVVSKATEIGVPDDVLYERSPRSPAQLEKALKSRPEHWKELTKLVTQSNGKPSVAPASDPRPVAAIANTLEDLQSLANIEKE